MGIERPWQGPTEAIGAPPLAGEIDTSYLLVREGKEYEISQVLRQGQDEVRLVLENGESLVYDTDDEIEAVKKTV